MTTQNAELDLEVPSPEPGPRSFPAPAATEQTASGIWIVVPAYNEGERLGRTLQGLMPAFGNIVVVDDGSRDHTVQVALDHSVWVVRHLFNLGQGAALQTGIDFALSRGAQYLVTFDADGQHEPADIRALLEPVMTGQAEIALGSRFLGQAVGVPWTRRVILKLGVLFTRIFSRIRITDTHNGLRAFSREAALQIRINQNRMAHASEILDQIALHRLRYCEVPVTIHYTTDTLAKGQSSFNAIRIAAQFLLGRWIR